MLRARARDLVNIVDPLHAEAQRNGVSKNFLRGRCNGSEAMGLGCKNYTGDRCGGSEACCHYVCI